MTDGYIYIETLNIEEAEKTINDICERENLWCSHDGITDFYTSVFKVGDEFPVGDIEDRGWYIGFAVKDD